MNLERRPSRVIIDRIRPEIDGGRYAAKRFIDQPVEIRAVVLTDGHDRVKARLLYRHESEDAYRRVPFRSRGNDEWRAVFQPERLGLYYFRVEAGLDRFGTWKSDLLKKQAAGQNLANDLRTGAELIRGFGGPAPLVRKLETWAGAPQVPELKEVLDDAALVSLADPHYDEESRVESPREIPLRIEPARARFSAWYEFFPRSLTTATSAKASRGAGNLRLATERLEDVRAMGFDVVYLPPIHPIGRKFRKGKNNALSAETDDVGSPWAIGGAEGGHKAIHPDLGDFSDFDKFVRRARELDIDVAMDIAFQCSPDHPYVKEHPTWFKKRPDGTIQYAENPPKKYQDIYPFDFESADWRGLWQELKSVFEFWIEKGVRTFRVDNPHTKAFHFWEWIIRELKSKHPDLIFLAEAFTRPHVMDYLAKAGFTQSYTYFTWRNLKWELSEYVTQLTREERVEYFNPNFWPNTPDILPEALQKPDRALHLARLYLAATLSGNYGIYGPAFELMAGDVKSPGGEEYLNSEKYEIKTWNLQDPRSLAPEIAKLNRLRRENPALQQTRDVELLKVPNEQLFAFAKNSAEGRIVVVVNLDSTATQSGWLELPMREWGLDPERAFEVRDLLTEERYVWKGWHHYVELNPQKYPAHILKFSHATVATFAGESGDDGNDRTTE